MVTSKDAPSGTAQPAGGARPAAGTPAPPPGPRSRAAGVGSPAARPATSGPADADTGKVGSAGLDTGPETTPLVVGLDLSMTCTGIALWDGSTDTIKTRDGTGDWRLVDIRRRLSGYIGTPPAALVVIEDVPPIRARSLAIIGMVHGAVRELLARLGVPYVLVPPASVKKYATGKGTATKPDMRMALFKRAGLDLRDDNEVDAWWLRAMGLDHLGRPPVQLPKTHRDALVKVNWPQLEGIA